MSELWHHHDFTSSTIRHGFGFAFCYLVRPLSLGVEIPHQSNIEQAPHFDGDVLDSVHGRISCLDTSPLLISRFRLTVSFIHRSW